MTWQASFAPLRSRNFAWYYASRFVNTLGSMMANVALTFAVLDITDSASALGAVLRQRGTGVFAARGTLAVFGGAGGAVQTHGLTLLNREAAGALGCDGAEGALWRWSLSAKYEAQATKAGIWRQRCHTVLQNRTKVPFLF